MPETALDRLVDRFLAHHATFHPVDATFMGLPGHDDRLPPAGPEAAERERDGVVSLLRDLDAAPVADAPGPRLDARLMRAALVHAGAALDAWPRFRQPSWYTGEAAFGLVSLLLPAAPAGAAGALAGRLEALPAFLAAGRAFLSGRPTPATWCERARRECEALARLLTEGLPRHPLWRDALARPAEEAAAAAASFARSLTGLPPREPACGRDYLSLLMREIHGLPWSPEEATALAREAFHGLGERIARHPARRAAPDAAVPPPELPAAYRRWHERALEDAAGLVTPATEYGLSFEPLPPWVRPVAGELYFLSYRCPPALAAGAGSVYWTAPVEQPPVAIKQTHAVHHGSIGHHTQNARARAAPSRLARLAGTDGASGIALLSAGTMVEGWSCYATELIAEAPGFYTAADELASLQAERRNAGSVLADIGLHAGGWGLERMRAFYRDEVGFPAARVAGETVRNSILPATRLMYWLGTKQIKDLRRELGGPTRVFHDELISHGHVPVAWAAEEMRDARRSAGPLASTAVGDGFGEVAGGPMPG